MEEVQEEAALGKIPAGRHDNLSTNQRGLTSRPYRSGGRSTPAWTALKVSLFKCRRERASHFDGASRADALVGSKHDPEAIDRVAHVVGQIVLAIDRV